MNGLKKVCAALLALLILGTVCACHKKGEVAVTAGDEEFTSAEYLYYLVNANAEAMQKVEDNLTDEEKVNGDYDIYSKEIDGKSYENWVKDTAMANLKKTAAYVILCKENDVEPEKEDIEQIEQSVEIFWENEYYESSRKLFEENGVYRETYLKCVKDALYETAYFNFLYGEGGKKEVSADELKTALQENFMLADRLNVTFQEETDEEKTEIKTKLEGYVTSIQNGSMTFEQAYHDYNGEEEHEEEAESSDELKPLDSHAELIPSEDANKKLENYSFTTDGYDTLKDMKNGEVKLVEKEDGAGYLLLVKKDILADEYYVKDKDASGVIRHLLKDEEYEKDIDDYVGKMNFDINKYAVNRFKVKKLKTGTEQ